MRASGAAFVFGGKMWVLGGWNGGAALNDIWNTSDGVNWTQVMTNAPWMARDQIPSLVYSNRIWVIGGRNYASRLNDVWSSADGVNWIQDSAAWTKRTGEGAAVSNGKLYVIGGENTDYVYTNDVWFSTGSGLSSIPNTNILETVPWQYTPTVSGSGYTFGLSNAPAGMTVNASSGLISWTPTEAQGPGTNANITYAVYQSGATVAWTNFTVIVLESNRPPVLTVPDPQTIYATTTLTVTNTATDPDFPANALTFAVVSAQSVLAINPTTGVLTWSPTSGQVGTNIIAVSVTDYNPWAINSQQLSVTNSFTVIVKGLTAPSFTQQPSNAVVNPGRGFTFTAAATGYPAPTYQWQFSSNGVTYVNLSGATGASYSPGASGVTNIGYYRVLAANSLSTNTSASVSLSFLNINMYAGLNILGPLGANYNVQAIAALGGSNWTTLTNVALPSQPYIYIDYSSPTNSKQFYRAVPQ